MEYSPLSLQGATVQVIYPGGCQGISSARGHVTPPSGDAIATSSRSVSPLLLASRSGTAAPSNLDNGGEYAMFDNIKECQIVGDLLARLLAREFGVQTAFICVSTEEGPPEEAVEAPTVTETSPPEMPLPAPPG